MEIIVQETRPGHTTRMLLHTTRILLIVVSSVGWMLKQVAHHHTVAPCAV